MKKVKKPWSRKKRALFRLVFILPLLVLMVLSCRYGFTEEHALREHEEQAGIGTVQVIRNIGELPIGDIEKENLTLSGNENALLLSMQRFDWKNGWVSGGRATLDCSTGQDVMASYWQLSEMGEEPEEEVYYFFGEVANEEIQSLRIQLKLGEQEELVWETEVSEKDWITWKGRRLFLTVWQPEKPLDEMIWREFELVSVDADGTTARHSFDSWTHGGAF